MGRAKVLEWVFAALNSVEMPAVPWSLYKWADDNTQSPGRARLDRFLMDRLDRLAEEPLDLHLFEEYHLSAES